LRIGQADGWGWVNTVQHPNGKPKQFAICKKLVVDELEQFLRYQADTAQVLPARRYLTTNGKSSCSIIPKCLSAILRAMF
jgi:hypothetical protein